jgi:hypothetical protein
MRMAPSLEMRFEEKRNVHLRFHQDGARFGKPLIKLLCPGPVNDTRRRKHRAFDGEFKRAR